MIEETLYTALSPLVGGRVSPDFAEVGTELPFIVYNRIGGSVIKPLNKSLPDKEVAMVQIDVWHTTRLAASTLAKQVEDTLRQLESVAAMPHAAIMYDSDPDLKWYGTKQTFDIAYTK